MDHATHDCCAHDHTPTQPHSRWSVSAHATLHCLTGCVIGEAAGLMIGVSLGLHPYIIMALATALAFITGFSLTVFPLMKRTNLPFRAAFKAVWLGELVSITVMELAMNTVDYHMGGMRAGSVLSLPFWEAMGVAIIAGYLAAWPVNAWLIGRELKRCH